MQAKNASTTPKFIRTRQGQKQKTENLKRGKIYEGGIFTTGH